MPFSKENETLVIAEAGVNHNGDERIAIDLINSAFECGADIVKFQTFKANSLVTKYAKKAEYQSNNTSGSSSQYEMLHDLELSHETYLRLKSHCLDLGIEFLSTAFDSSSLVFLTDELKLKLLKIPSGEITNLPLVVEYARTGSEIIMSTGMSSIEEIKLALGALAFGYLNKESEPSLDLFEEAFSSIDGRSILNQNVTLLHCVTEYPAPINEINLSAMETMTKLFDLKVGYSDHTEGINASIAAVALGAKVIEKHFTMDKTMEGPDHKASLDPDELKKMISSIREVESMIGDGEKKIMPCEIKNKVIARKSIVALLPVKKGEVFTKENLTFKRPGSGKPPSRFWDLLGKNAEKDYEVDDLI
jgi:N-acetylneuraminate synthase